MGKIDGGYSSLQPTKKFAAMILVVPLIIKTKQAKQRWYISLSKLERGSFSSWFLGQVVQKKIFVINESN